MMNQYPGNTMTVRRRALRRGSSNSFANRVRSLAPYKHNAIPDASNTAVMTHNTIYTTSITAKVAQGDTNADRDGDAIILTAFKWSGVYNSPTTAGAYICRVLIGYSGEEYNVTGSNAGLIAAELFLPGTGGSFFARAIVNPKAFTVLSDTFYDVNSLITTTSDVKTVEGKIQLSGKFPYQQSTSAFGKFKNLYMVVISGVVGGVSGTTASGSFFINTDLIFQNS